MRYYKPFQFKQFSITQNNAAMKVGTDSVLLGAWAKIYQNERVLDIGTGTGILSLMLAQKAEGKCLIDAIEIDKRAILDAKVNFATSNWAESLTLHNMDFNNFNSKIPYDVIISNPPFFEGLAPKVSNRSIARNASDKLSYKNLLERASQLLKDNGRMYLIIPQEYYDKVIVLGLENNLQIENQLPVKPKSIKPINRVLIEFIKNFEPINRTINQKGLIVRDDNNQYTKEHIELTKAYYLHF